MAGNNILLDPLVELEPPATVSMLPQTIGWKVLLGLAVILICYYSYKKLKAWRLNRYRRDAIKALSAISSHSKTDKILQLNRILKQTASAAFGVTEVAGLHGVEWLTFLDKSSKVDFDSPQAQLWQQALYDPKQSDEISDSELEQLINKSRQWINQHEVSQ